ncbi:hypothetical protein GE061_018838 [Apolygus lucorum]|uniref:Uncharacterized protein n=1 Tax=Apolygus lucorum TaxID=248454 RepID=A0A6A4J6N7_APOLU|nr:hypothetical protein GE061_018838 [Apolygus lucorum]
MAEDRVEKLVYESSQFIREKMTLFCSHWKAMYGLDAALIDKYCTTVQYNIENLFKDIQDHVEMKKNKLIQEVENKLQEHDQLQKELNLRIDEEFSSDQPLSDVIKSLDIQLEQYRKTRGERMQMLASLQEKEWELCQCLDEAPYLIQVTVPSDAQLAGIQQNLRRLQNIRIDRRSRYLDLKLKILNFMNVLEIGPTSDFERNALMDEEESFHLTTSNLHRLEELLLTHEQSIRYKEEQIELLIKKLETIWNCISEDESLKKNFLNQCNGVGQSTMTMILNEIERCEEIKRANIKPCIETIRRDIANLWERLTYTELEKKQFSAYHTDEYNEDVLELHEMEYTRLEQVYETCKGILDLAEQRSVLWDRMKQLHEHASSPSRFKNRGGHLLREEKERRAVEKNLPKIESQLKKCLVSYYEQHGKPFLWHGQDLLQKIAIESGVENKTFRNSRSSKVSTPRGTPSKENSRRGSSSVFRINLSANTNDLDDASLDSYSQFQEQIEFATSLPTPKNFTPHTSKSKRIPTPFNRNSNRFPLRQIQPSPLYRAHSSPTMKPKPTPRRNISRKNGFPNTDNSLPF